MDYTYLDTPCVDDRGQPLLSVQDNSMSLYDASSIGVQLALVFFVSKKSRTGPTVLPRQDELRSISTKLRSISTKKGY